MKFVKDNVKLLIGFIIGALLTGGIVYAVTSASQISYTTEKNENIENVSEALNDLYVKRKIDIKDALSGKTYFGRRRSYF